MSQTSLFDFKDEEERKAFLIALPVIALFGLVACYFIFWDDDSKAELAHNVAKTDRLMADRDSDGIGDNIDRCPDTAGEMQHEGCSLVATVIESDKNAGTEVEAGSNANATTVNQNETTSTNQVATLGSNSVNASESHPEPKPVTKFADTDSDGINDNIDQCPDLAGGEANNGCPVDTDSGGVNDNIDQCPDLAGAEANNGCPVDTDSDGLSDDTDQCPDLAGNEANNGCPVDTDGDGLSDDTDQCPDLAGNEANNGCPDKSAISLNEESGIAESAEKLVRDAGFKIQFNPGSAVLTRQSSEILLQVAEVLERYPSLLLEAHGHSDSLGSPEANTSLSLARAQACLDVVVAAGIDDSRLQAIGFGDGQPIADNNSEAGRSQNRRVEFKLISN